MKHAFRLPAMVPEMHWIDSVRPEGPLSVSVSTVPNGTKISWTLRQGITEETDKPRMLAIYRFRDTSIAPASSNLLTVFYVKGTTTFIDETAYESKMWYRVTLVDRLWNESQPSYAASYTGPVHRPLPVTMRREVTQPVKELPEITKVSPS
ncbi:MAG: hypothetical protein EOO92_07680, partial [Pedobacter sp.]